MATRKKATREKRDDYRTGRAPVKREFPVRLAASPEEWRALKRTEWREVRQALTRFYHGSAYVPAGVALYQIGRLVDQMTEAIEAEDWIAW